MFDKITATEQEAFKHYIRSYGPECGIKQNYSDIADLKVILEPWRDAKSLNLYKLFGNELILSKKIDYQKSVIELADEYRKIYWENNSPLAKFHDSLNTVLYDKVANDPNNQGTFWLIRNLLDFNVIVSNEYKGNDIEYNIPNTNTKLKLVKGGKIIKFLRKFSEIHGIKEFPEFAIAHSQILNQKKLKGTLHLSIHPLDYATMSDNNNNWTSCMSWREYGCYRQGTVEMLNSPNTIVAYLSSDSECYNINGLSWNSKKWRELFVITPEVIAGCLGYPYYNSSLEIEVLDWLKELAYKNLGWQYEDKISKFNNSYSFDSETHSNVIIHFNSEFMYNDFEQGNEHQAYIAQDLKYDNINITYSGNSECMVCGETCGDIRHESHLVCGKCCEYVYCYKCGELLTGDSEIMEHNGQSYCAYCFEDLPTCDSCGDIAIDEEAVEIQIMNLLEYSWYRRICRDCYKKLLNKDNNYIEESELDKFSLDSNEIIIEAHSLTIKGKSFLNI